MKTQTFCHSRELCRSPTMPARGFCFCFLIRYLMNAALTPEQSLDARLHLGAVDSKGAWAAAVNIQRETCHARKKRMKQRSTENQSMTAD